MRASTRRIWLDKELRRMEKALRDGLSQSEVALRFKTSNQMIRKLAETHGWPLPVTNFSVRTPPKRHKNKRGSAFSLSHLSQSDRAEVQARELKLYGTLLPDVQFLRRGGFVIHCEKGGYRVGNRLLDSDGVRAVAARERRLAVAA